MACGHMLRGGAQRHRRMHAEFPGLIGRRGDDAALVALPANDDSFAFQRGIEELFHGDEEGVHIDVEDGAREGGLGWAAAMRIVAAETSLNQIGGCGAKSSLTDRVRSPIAANRAHVRARYQDVSSHSVSYLRLISLYSIPYVMLRGAELPVQSEWIIFAVALALVGLCSVAVGVLPRSWIAKACGKDRDDTVLFSPSNC